MRFRTLHISECRSSAPKPLRKAALGLQNPLPFMWGPMTGSGWLTLSPYHHQRSPSVATSTNLTSLFDTFLAGLRFKCHMWGQFSLQCNKNSTGVYCEEREARGRTRAPASTPVARSVWTRLGPRDLRNRRFPASRKGFYTCTNPEVVQDSATTLEMATHPCAADGSRLDNVADIPSPAFTIRSHSVAISAQSSTYATLGSPTAPRGLCLQPRISGRWWTPPHGC